MVMELTTNSARQEINAWQWYFAPAITQKYLPAPRISARIVVAMQRKFTFLHSGIEQP